MGTRTRKVPLFAYTPVCWTVNGHLYWVRLEMLRCVPGRPVSVSLLSLVDVPSWRRAHFDTVRPGAWVRPHNHQIETAYTTAQSTKAERPADLISAGHLVRTASDRDRARHGHGRRLRISTVVRKVP